MAPHVLFMLLGTRSDALHGASLAHTLRHLAEKTGTFDFRLAGVNQEDTELQQALDACNLHLDAFLDGRKPHVADANLDHDFIRLMESTLRRHRPSAVIICGAGTSAWSMAIAAYYKKIPLIHLETGGFPPLEERPMPEWLYHYDVLRLSQLHLCPDSTYVARLEESLAPLGVGLRPFAPSPHPPREDWVAEYAITGYGVDHQRDLELDKAFADPTLGQMDFSRELVLTFVRRREHHANALRPLCRSLDELSQHHENTNFLVVHSLQSYICDALTALLPRRGNLRDISPLPPARFWGLLARSRLLVTDSEGVAREALLLGRPLVLVGSYSQTQTLEKLSQRWGPEKFRVVPMEQEKLSNACRQMLREDAPPPVEAFPESPQSPLTAGRTVADWFHRAFALSGADVSRE